MSYLKDFFLAATSACNDATATAWQNLMRFFRSPPVNDKVNRARFMLRQSIRHIEESESTIQQDLKKLQAQCQQWKKQQDHASKPQQINCIKNLLQASKQKRQKLSFLRRQKQLLEQNDEALLNTTVNQQVLSSVKETAGVLKSLGLEEKIESVDALMMDMNDNLGNVNMINEGLAEPFHPENFDNHALEHELEIMMQSDDFFDLDFAETNTAVTNIKSVNSMSATEVSQDDCTDEKEKQIDEQSVSSDKIAVNA